MLSEVLCSPFQGKKQHINIIYINKIWVLDWAVGKSMFM